MSDRYKGFLVTLDKDYRDDDSQCIIDAIKMIKGVVGVKPIINGIDVNHDLIETRVKRELIDKLWNVLS